ncbi:MAG: amidohydrolase [Firmicutes bacterium]|nr:amidohydrolase [Bacillota bacterium]
MSILFTNASVLCREEGGYNVLQGACLGVTGDRISYIGFDIPEEKYDTIKDMSGKLLMPGLVNAHGHSAMTLVRGAGSGLPLDRWLNEAIFPIEDKMTPADIRAGVAWACLEMIAGGTTQAADMYDYPFAAAEVYADSGMKVNLCRVGLCFDPELEPGDWPRTAECINFINVMHGSAEINPEAIREIPETAGTMELPENIREAVASGRIKADFCLHSEYLTTKKFVKAISEANSVMHRSLHVHVSETEKEHRECMERRGKTPIEYLEDMGILDEPVYAAHCVWVTDRDLDIMAEKGATIVHNPTSNMKLGSGAARIPDAIAAGVNVALGTDGAASNNNLNMFEEMHIAALLPKGTMKDPVVLTDAQVLDMATVNGARALGRPDTGILREGFKADIIAVDMSAPHMKPASDPVALLVYSAQASDVCMTMADGRILYEDGQFFTIDRDRAERDLMEAVERLFG